MGGVDGVGAAGHIRGLRDGPPVLVLTTFDDDEVLSGALRAGASGFQLKDAAGEDLIRAAKAVAAGDGWLDPAVTGRVLAAYRDGAPSQEEAAVEVEALTARELEGLRLIGRGASNAEGGAELFIGQRT